MNARPGERTPERTAERRQDPRDAVVGRPRLGLCSVTFRRLTPQDIVAAAREAGLESIEWGSDVHVPAGDLERAEAVGELTREAGLTVASYGSYFGSPWAAAPGEDAADLVASAVALGSPRIRVWAGPTGSADASPDTRRQTTSALRHFCRIAADAGVSVALEFHGGTLTDSAASTLQLLEDLGPGCATTYWQPRVGASDDEALDDLDRLGGAVSTLHVFSWDARASRHPLLSREDLWRRVVARAVTRPAVTDLLLEFVPDDDPALLRGETEFLKRLLLWTEPI